MELAIAPPTRVAAGIPFPQPLVVIFTVADKENQVDNVDNVDGESIEPLPDLSGSWAFLSLVTHDLQLGLAPPRTDLLKGRTADSIHYVYHEQEGGRIVIAYVSFPELLITEPGTYRIKVNLIDMNV
jgi:hypothetical protein